MSRSLVDALRTVAKNLEGGAAYQWGHMGQCNCGHLAQVVCKKTAAEIHRSALLRATGEWSEHAFDYCAGSGYLIDDVVDELLALGMTREDIEHLEYLSDPKLLARVGRPLQKNVREDAIAYFAALADVVEAALPVALPTTNAPATKQAA